MEDYKEILSSNSVYEKYKRIIPNSNVTSNKIIEKLSIFYNFVEDDSTEGRMLLKHYEGVGQVYRIEPQIVGGLINVPKTLMYVNDEKGLFQISGQSQKFIQKVMLEVTLLRGLTEQEHEDRKLVFHYVDMVKSYFD